MSWHALEFTAELVDWDASREACQLWKVWRQCFGYWQGNRGLLSHHHDCARAIYLLGPQALCVFKVRDLINQELWFLRSLIKVALIGLLCGLSLFLRLLLLLLRFLIRFCLFLWRMRLIISWWVTFLARSIFWLDDFPVGWGLIGTLRLAHA